MRATIETIVDGTVIKHTGRFIQKQNAVICNKGMKLTFKDGDKITFHETEKRNISKIENCPFDMYQWFKKSKQI